jgi:hypothetical protein
MTGNFVLEKATAVKQGTGVYRWALSHQNTIYRPLTVAVGPVSITTASDHRNFIIQSDDFTRSDRGMSMLGDTLKPVVTVVHPHQRFKHEYVAQVGDITPAEIEALATYWLDMSSLDYFTNQNWVTPAGVGDHLQHVTARVPAAGVNFTRGATNMIQVVQYGPAASQLFGVTRGTGSWSYAIDGSSGNPPFLDTSADIYLFKTASALGDFDIGMRHRKQSWRVYGGNIEYQTTTAGGWVNTLFTWQPSTDYMLVLEEDQTASPIGLKSLLIPGLNT